MDSLAHAKHNERVCNYLGRSADFGDWVITTAFYSAMHYVRHLMVPIMIEGDVYNDFESLFAKRKSMMEGRHGFMKSYVVSNFPEIAFEYSRLHDMSTTARYSNYVYTREQANMAKGYMENIKQHMLRLKP